MKTPSGEYTLKEESSQRQPVELYHIWRDGGEDWYYTSGDVPVVFGTPPQTYLPATLKRSPVKYNAQLEVTTFSVDAGYLEDPVLEYIAVNPIEIIWVSIMKLHRDMVPLEASVVVVGQIKNTTFKGNIAKIDCVGFEHFLKMPIPFWRYQTTCNYRVFDSHCKLDKDAKDGDGNYIWKVTATITLDATKTILTSATFAAYEDGYFTFGTVEFGDEKRMVSNHVGNQITLAYQMRDLISDSVVTVYPGCDGKPETCRDKFNNVDNSLWFPFIPEENPAIRTPQPGIGVPTIPPMIQ